MDPITLVLRASKTPAASAPVGGELSAAEVDANWNNLKTACEQLEAEKLDVADATTLTDVSLPLLASDETVIFRGGVGYKAPLSALKTFVLAASAPAAFTAGQWTATAGVGSIELNITALPDNGGSAITALEYRLNGGSAVALSGTGTGVRTITGLTGGVSYDVQIRAVNAVGNGAWSDTKTRTPTSAGGTLAIVQAPAPAEQPFGTSVTRSITAVGSGNALVICVISSTSGGAPTITDSAGGTWSSVLSSFTGVNTGASFRFYSRANITNAPTSVTATWSGDVEAALLVVEVSGAGSSIALDASGGAAQSTTTAYSSSFTSTVANTLFLGAATYTNSTTTTGVAPVTSADIYTGFGHTARGIFPTAGSNTATINLAAGRTGDRAFAVFRPGP